MQQREVLSKLANDLIKDDGVTSDQRGNISEVLYTACETGILDFDSLSVDDAILIYNLVMIGRVIDEDLMKFVKM